MCGGAGGDGPWSRLVWSGVEWRWRDLMARIGVTVLWPATLPLRPRLFLAPGWLYFRFATCVNIRSLKLTPLKTPAPSPYSQW